MAVELKLIAARVARGDRHAFRHIVEHTRAPLFRLAARLLGNAADAEDVLQQSYLKAFRAMADGRFDGRSRVLTWLHRIVTNAALDRMRRRREKPTDKLPDTATHDTPDAHLALQKLDRWLRDLPDGQRAALVLCAMEGLSNAEAAHVLGCSEGAVEQRLVRARATLRARRDDEEGSP